MSTQQPEHTPPEEPASGAPSPASPEDSALESIPLTTPTSLTGDDAIPGQPDTAAAGPVLPARADPILRTMLGSLLARGAFLEPDAPERLDRLHGVGVARDDAQAPASGQPRRATTPHGEPRGRLADRLDRLANLNGVAELPALVDGLSPAEGEELLEHGLGDARLDVALGAVWVAWVAAYWQAKGIFMQKAIESGFVRRARAVVTPEAGRRVLAVARHHATPEVRWSAASITWGPPTPAWVRKCRETDGRRTRAWYQMPWGLPDWVAPIHTRHVYYLAGSKAEYRLDHLARFEASHWRDSELLFDQAEDLFWATVPVVCADQELLPRKLLLARAWVMSPQHGPVPTRSHAYLADQQTGLVVVHCEYEPRWPDQKQALWFFQLDTDLRLAPISAHDARVQAVLPRLATGRDGQSRQG